MVCNRDLPDATVANRLDSRQKLRWIAEAMNELSEREMTIIRARRLAEETVTLESLGKSLGISKERVRQIEHEALGKLRGVLLIKTDGDPRQAGLL